ncbi:MAG: BatA domain-containing protein [Robiginitalea sp.]
MQLQHPEFLWGLLLLVLPILVHLLKLRRFQKTPFTNVTLLKRILAESNKSSQLKKWLLLLSRLGLLSALAIAFCKPFIPSQKFDLKKDILVYLDNSFSMQAKGESTTLLQQAVQDLLQSFPPELDFTLMTQSEIYPKMKVADLQERLLDLDFSPGTPTGEEIRLRAEARFARTDSADRQLWILSDFHQWDTTPWKDWDRARVLAIPYRPETPGNISIDSAYLVRDDPEKTELNVLLTLHGDAQNSPVSLYQGNRLIAKTGGEPLAENLVRARFTLPASGPLNGTLQVTDNGLSYDNTLFITQNKPPLLRVLGIGPQPAPFLDRIFTPEEFSLLQTTLRELDYSILEQQHLVLLNELEEIPQSLAQPLQEFLGQGGSLVVIPSNEANTNTYNRFFNGLGVRFGPRTDGEILITEINFEHPLFRNVFEKQIENFDYPGSRSYYPVEGRLPLMIGYQNGEPFLSGQNGLYVFASPLSGDFSNFRQSPLIVPSLYSIGKQSLPGADLYYQIGQEARLDLDISLQEDEILQLRGSSVNIIPQQQSFARKTRLFFGLQPDLAGNYLIDNQGDSLLRVSFNYPRTEKISTERALALPGSFEILPDMDTLVSGYQNRNRNTPLWKWFVILALLFVLAEMILQKTMR